MCKKIVEFLLEVPPIEEIGGQISSIIEQYRAGAIEKENCITRILSDHQPFLHKYIDNNVDIKRRMR